MKHDQRACSQARSEAKCRLGWRHVGWRLRGVLQTRAADPQRKALAYMRSLIYWCMRVSHPVWRTWSGGY